MLVFTVFSTIMWNGIFDYNEGKAEIWNDWNLLTGKWKTREIVVPPVSQKDLSPMVSPRTADDPHEGERKGGKSMLDTDYATTVSKTFGQRFRDDRDFRSSFCRFGDRLCLFACFIVYLVCFVVICTESSNERLYGALEVEDVVEQAEAGLNATLLGTVTTAWA